MVCPCTARHGKPQTGCTECGGSGIASCCDTAGANCAPGLAQKICVICGVGFSQRENERNHDFASRKTCSRDCRNELIGLHSPRRTGNADWTRLKQPWPQDLWYGDNRGR